MENRVLRGPNPAYTNKNGFIQGFTEREQVDNIQRAVDNHRAAMLVFHYRKREIPDFETMKAQAEETNLLTTAKENLEALRKDHIEDLDRLYRFHTYEYQQEIQDRRRVVDDNYLADADPSIKSLVEKLVTGPHKDADAEARWQNDYENLRYSHLKQVVHMEKRIQDLERQQEIEKKLREQMFPQDVADFKKKTQEIQQRVARFLVANDAEKERYLNAFNWAYRQTAPLQELYKQDERFKSDILAIIVSGQATDPRRNATR
ncbi:hypothetical protein BDN70DRAFT_874837 [Pholiota conissans]|uniref:Uncharacterized protein n=1 Tax=Pholiota conissans TaxID=109636 RepID=A0A9P6D3N0_9AGAR|nr:hypothetical protein BDN70DRAFT_874837 [Pholiota conissans]